MARERKARVHGPYKHGQRWRVEGVGEDGRRLRPSFDTEREALAFIAAVRKRFETRTIGSTVDEYLDSLRARGLRASTVTRASYHLDRVLELATRGHEPMRHLTPALAAELYIRLQAGRAVDTHRNGLAAARALGRWCVDRGILEVDPFARVKPMGRRKRGKPQPRIDEARKLLGTGAKLALAGDEGAIAALVAILMAPRASEIGTRAVRDLDDDGRLLWIPDSKTQAGRRTIEVPEMLRAPLLALAAGRAGTEPLLGRGPRSGEPRSRYWVREQVRRLCGLAGVPPTSPQALRGLHSTVARLSGQTAHAVAATLGHESPAITELAYIDRVAVEVEQRRGIVGRLTGGDVN